MMKCFTQSRMDVSSDETVTLSRMKTIIRREHVDKFSTS